MTFDMTFRKIFSFWLKMTSNHYCMTSYHVPLIFRIHISDFKGTLHLKSMTEFYCQAQSQVQVSLALSGSLSLALFLALSLALPLALSLALDYNLVMIWS